MSKKHALITQAASEAAMASGQLVPSNAFEAIQAASRKIVDRATERSEELAGPVIGIRIVNGCITDVIAPNGAVRIEG